MSALSAAPAISRLRSLRDRPSFLRWLTVIVFVCLAGWYTAFAVERYQSSHLFGDEPEYLFQGHSVWGDGDLDLRDEYLDPDLRAFPGPLVFKVDPAGGPAPANFLPTTGVLFTEPMYRAFGLLGTYLLYAAMNIASLALILIMLRRYIAPIPAVLAVALVGLSVPLAWHAASLWTEIPALLCVSGVLAMAPRIASDKRALVGAGLLLALLPWLHQKYIVLAGGLLLALLLDRARWRVAPLLAALPVVSIVGTFVFSLAVRGRINFTQAGATSDVASAFDQSWRRFVAQPFAWVFDQTRGYVPYAPVWILAFVGFAFLLRYGHGRKLLLSFAVGFVPFFLVYFAGPFLSGDAAPGRETLVALPALALLLGAGFHALRGAGPYFAATALSAVSVYMGTVPAFKFGMDIFFNNVGQPKLLAALSRPRLDLTAIWPRITVDRGFWSASTLIVVMVATAALCGWLYVSSRSRAERPDGRPWVFPEPTGGGG